MPIAAITLLFASHASAAAILVANKNDSGPGSLRQAVIDNNARGGGNTIVFSNSVTGTITLTSGQLLVTRNVTILGPGPGILAVNGNASSRVFHISLDAITVFISGLSITNGRVSGAFPGNWGGGIWNDHSTLTLSNCVVSGNYGGAGSGGAIYNDGMSSSRYATLWIIASTISGNSANSSGGCIYNGGYQGNAAVSVIASTISGNTAIAAGSVGGAIFNDGSSGNAGVAVSASTFSGNSASQSGGAIHSTGAGAGFASVSLRASTFSGNSAPTGGGIVNQGFGGTANLTIGGTIFQTGASGANIVNNGGAVNSFGYNLSSDNGAGFLTNATDQPHTDPLLGPLADNGGPTHTHALLPGSRAIDKGNGTGYTTDQRGQPRRFDFGSIRNATGGDGSDIGAFEVGPPQLRIETGGTNAVLSWPAYSASFSLECSTNLTLSNNWMSVTGSVTRLGDRYQQTNGPISGNRFFRLRGS